MSPYNPGVPMGDTLLVVGTVVAVVILVIILKAATEKSRRK